HRRHQSRRHPRQSPHPRHDHRTRQPPPREHHHRETATQTPPNHPHLPTSPRRRAARRRRPASRRRTHRHLRLAHRPSRHPPTPPSAWPTAKAATQPPIPTLSVAVVGVRTFGLARAGLRYAERLVTHDAAFRDTAKQRLTLWRTADFRRLTTDLDTVRDLTPRV